MIRAWAVLVSKLLLENKPQGTCYYSACYSLGMEVMASIRWGTPLPSRAVPGDLVSGGRGSFQRAHCCI